MRLEHRKLIYLASPYTHPDSEVRENRFESVCKATAALIAKGYYVFSPIASSHPIAVKYNLPTPYHFWQEFNELMISRSDYVVVLELDGWKESVGVSAERAFAERIGKPIFFADPEQIEFFALGGISRHAASSSV